MIISINKNKFNVKTVFSPKHTQNGMMGKKFDAYDGMLFFMKNEPHSFWMKYSVIHLDIIYIHDHKIVKIHHNCKPCFENDCDHYEGSGDLVLELPGGTCKKYNIKEDNEVILL